MINPLHSTPLHFTLPYLPSQLGISIHLSIQQTYAIPREDISYHISCDPSQTQPSPAQPDRERERGRGRKTRRRKIPSLARSYSSMYVFMYDRNQNQNQTANASLRFFRKHKTQFNFSSVSCQMVSTMTDRKRAQERGENKSPENPNTTTHQTRCVV